MGDFAPEKTKVGTRYGRARSLLLGVTLLLRARGDNRVSAIPLGVDFTRIDFAELTVCYLSTMRGLSSVRIAPALHDHNSMVPTDAIMSIRMTVTLKTYHISSSIPQNSHATKEGEHFPKCLR